MRFATMRFATMTMSAILALIAGLPAFADDSEIFAAPSGSTGNPNILLILDTSGSMGSNVTKPNPFDPNTTYSGSCNSTEVYYVTSGAPSCNSKHFPNSNLKCDAANTSLYGVGATGTYSGNAIRWLHGVTTTATTVSTSTVVKHTNRVKKTVTFTWTDKNSVSNISNTFAPYGVTISHDTGTSVTITGPTTQSLSDVTDPTVAPPGTTTNSVSDSYSWQTSFTKSNSSAGPTSSNSTSSSQTSSDTGWVAGSTSGGNTKTMQVTDITETVTTTVTTTTSVSSSTTYTLTDVNCDDDKTTGTVVGGTAKYPTNVGNAASRPEWDTTKADSYWDTGGALQPYVFYSGNYINYKANPPGTNLGTRLSIVKTAASNLLDSLTNVNVGLMRYSDNGGSGDTAAQGGMVTYALSDVTANKANLKSTISGYNAAGYTPLSETLYEAYLYYSGGTVKFGDTSKINSGSTSSPSVAASRTGNTLTSHTYQSPITASCQNNYIVYLTDGEPTQDNQADSLIQGLPNEAALGGACEDDTQAPYGSGWGPGNSAGKCLAALTQYMNHADMSSTYVNNQTVQTYFIGFGSDFASGGLLNEGFQYLQRAAIRGGGLAYSAQDDTGLAAVLSKIATDIAERSYSFSAPTVAVNAFNRTQTLNDLFVSVFQPATTFHWPGNVKKYHVVDGAIVDAHGAAAVDTQTGFFSHSAQSYWSPDVDGDGVPKGGAAVNIPDPSGASHRNVYTYLSNNIPSSPVDLTGGTQYLFDSTNALIDNARLNIGGATDPTRDDLINWARGQDVQDKDPKNGNTTEARHVMGDPVHARPAAVIYGGTVANPDIVVFAPTNDGYLHAFAGGDTQGQELWTFIPQEALSDLKSLYSNVPTSTKHYSLDGDVKVLKYDINGDGTIDANAGDKVIIYFGQGRGGSRYYAMDVTNKNAPKFMWSIGPGELPGVGQAWSAPAITRAKISGGSQNSQNLVLIFGGGYDTAEDVPTGVGSGYHASDSVGNRIFMVDALTGTLLWYAGNTASANLNLSRMDHAIPSNITVMDFDTDGYADRMYVGDMAGQIWRFDIFKNVTAANLVTGGVIASLGDHDLSPASASSNRRFYNAPDVAGIQLPGVASFLNIAIGSGYRGHPLETQAHDRFYSIRDYLAFTKLSQVQYNAYTIVTDSSLTNVTDLSLVPPATAPGWKLDLNNPWQGEKVLVPSTTFQNQILFTTYLPINPVANGQGSCSSTVGANRSYVVNAVNGAPLPKYAEVTDPVTGVVSEVQQAATQGDRFTDMKQGGIAPELAFLFPGGNQVVCLSGAEVLGICKSFNSRMKTYWKESDAQ